jgi:thiopurine S-methyltransferase
MTADDRAFWQERWDRGEIGFHEGAPNDLLVAHIGALERDRAERLRVLVPLAGKAEDSWWLADRGHEVVGVEFVMEALEAFYSSRGIDLRQHEHALGSLRAFTAGGVTMLCDDFFAVTPAAVGTFDAIYDRAALVALEPSTRARYVELCRALCKPDARVLLIAFTYDQTKAPGPPWSLDRATVEALWGPVTPLQTRASPPSGRLAAAGVESLAETAYLVTVRSK